jgi:hypothetical protein
VLLSFLNADGGNELMNQASDVRRLLSRLKMEDFKYREFAKPDDATDAAAAWPALHDVAIATGTVRLAECLAPAGDAPAKRRIARDRTTLTLDGTEPWLPAGPAARIDQMTTGTDKTVEASEREGERLGAALRQRLAAARSAPAGHPGGRDAPEESEPVPTHNRAPPPAAPGFFLGGSYRPASSLRRDSRAEPGGRGDNSLRAVFTRLSRDRDNDGRAAGAGRLPGRLR